MAQFLIEDLSFAYPGADKQALDHLSLEVEEGEYLTICGKSGCGKSTLLRHLKSALTPHGQRSGTVSYYGCPLDEVDMRKQSAQIGFVLQDPNSQIVTDKVWHELAFGLESLGCDQQVMRLRVAEMASYFGIQSWFHKDVRELSGGQKQLLNLASIMAMQPRVLILDEPTSQLDPIAAADFLNTIRKINLELGTTIIVTEHRLEEVFSLADRVAVMEQGHLIALGKPREVGFSLYETGNDMLSALPAPMRIYYGVKQSDSNLDTTLECPLTVREGHSWLSNASEDLVFSETEIQEAPLAEIEKDEVAFEFREVWFRYERDSRDILRDLSFKVPRNTLFALVGGNGTGKSTLLKAACGLVKPYRGSIRLFGKKLKDWKAQELYQGGLALLPQDPQNLFVKKTVREDLEEMFDGKKQISAESCESELARVAKLCQITELLDKHPFDLSGGEQQRAALAKVLLCHPQILFLDEPTKGIDSFFKKQFAGIIRDLINRGTTVLMVTHDVEFCASYADSVSMFFDGSLVTTNTRHAFFARNNFYTTAANRMSRHMFVNAITDEDVVMLCGSAHETEGADQDGE